MKLHRYYLPKTDLTHDFWMDVPDIFHQWLRVLRYEVGREIVLFNDRQEVRLYRITKIGDSAVHVELVTEMKPQLPKNDVYLCFSILKKDKNEWVLQKGTELGVNHFVPLITDRTEKTGWNSERAEKIVTEASEQCERGDIPRLREPITPQRLIEELKEKVPIVIAEQGEATTETKYDSVAILVGPEGGWSDEEKKYFETMNLPHYSLSSFTLRAETACIAAAALLQ